MMAGLHPGRGGALLHCRLRYFDPVDRRAGIAPDVAALIDEMTADQVTVTLVNLLQTQSRQLVVQTGAYAEHQGLSIWKSIGKGYRLINPILWFTCCLVPEQEWLYTRIVLSTYLP